MRGICGLLAHWLFTAALCLKKKMHTVMNSSSAADAAYRLNARPPASSGLSRKSPTTAPSGRVRMKAAQNNAVRERRVREYRATMTASKAVKTSAPPRYSERE